MLKINSLYDVDVYIAPYNNFENALELFPYSNKISASFKGGHNIDRWSGVLQECLVFAKFIKSYVRACPYNLNGIEVVEEVKFLWPSTKNEIILDRSYRDNGKKAKITIKTGAASSLGGAYLACEDDIKELIMQMAREIGIYEAQKKCDYWSAFVNSTSR